MTDYGALRDRMVERQIAARGLTDARLLQSFREVPREVFVPEELRHRAYEDCALPIEARQTISQPYIVALTIDAACIRAGDKLLEVGAGSGYAAAVMSRMARQVVAIERIAELAFLARGRMEALGCDNVRIVEGDGSLGCREEAPFDAILCAAAGPDVPESWKRQLAPGGRIVIPIGSVHGTQRLTRVQLDRDGRSRIEELELVRFVPLIGAEAYDPD